MRLKISLGSVVTLLLALGLGLRVMAQDTVLRGGVNKTDTLGGSGGPSLSRDDIKSSGDPFAKASDLPPDIPLQALDASAAAFGNPRKTFNANAAVNDEFGGTPIQGKPDFDQRPNLNQRPGQMGTPPKIKDEDASPEMQLAWDAWHKRVAGAIFQKFNFFSQSVFKFFPPMSLRMKYMVTSDGQIKDLQILEQNNTNLMFTTLVTQCVQSVNGDLSVLQFPQGSHRTVVEKFANFSQNMSAAGYRFTTGDKEIVR